MLGSENITKLASLKTRLTQLKKEILSEKENRTDTGNFKTNHTNGTQNNEIPVVLSTF